LSRTNNKNYKKQSEKKTGLKHEHHANHATQGTTKYVNIVGDKTHAETM